MRDRRDREMEREREREREQPQVRAMVSEMNMVVDERNARGRKA